MAIDESMMRESGMRGREGSAQSSEKLGRRGHAVPGELGIPQVPGVRWACLKEEKVLKQLWIENRG